MLLVAAAGARADVTPKIVSKPATGANIVLSFIANPLLAGSYYYAVMTLEPYRHYTAEHRPPCAVSSDMQKTDYGYPQDGKTSLVLTPTRSRTGHWCSGGSYEGAIYAVSPTRPCENTYSCEGERCDTLPHCRPILGVVVEPQRRWTYPAPPPEPVERNVQIVGWFVVRFHSHRFSTHTTRPAVAGVPAEVRSA